MIKGKAETIKDEIEVELEVEGNLKEISIELSYIVESLIDDISNKLNIDKVILTRKILMEIIKTCEPEFVEKYMKKKKIREFINEIV